MPPDPGPAFVGDWKSPGLRRMLIRAILPTEGIDLIASRRGSQPRKFWTNGPGKICQALAISGEFNGHDLCSPDALIFVEQGELIDDQYVTTGPWVGFNNVPEPWYSMPWRFRVEPDYLIKMSAPLKNTRQVELVEDGRN